MADFKSRGRIEMINLIHFVDHLGTVDTYFMKCIIILYAKNKWFRDVFVPEIYS